MLRVWAVPLPAPDRCGLCDFRGLESAGAGQDADTFGAAAEGLAADQCGVDERQDHNRDVQAGGLGEHTQGVGVADAQCPLVDRVIAGQGDNDRIGNLGAGRAWLAVLAADGAAGGLLDDGLIEEIEGAGVAMTWTVQPRSWARPTKVPMAVAGPAPHTLTDRTRGMRFLGHLAIPI